MRIVLKGYYGFGNLGDDVLLKVSYSLMKARFPNASFLVFSNHNRRFQDQKFNTYLYKLLNHDIEIIDWSTPVHADLVFNGGGGLYFDRKNGPFYYSIINRVASLLGAPASLRLDRFIRGLLRKPLPLSFKDRIGMGIGIETFTPTSDKFFEKLCELASYRVLFVRDDFSITQLHRFRCKGTFRKFTDLAFLTSAWKPATIQKKTNTVGVVLMDLPPDKQSLFNTLRGVARRARAAGYHVTFFSFDEEYDQRFYKAFPDENIRIWKPHEISLESYLTDLGSCEQIVSSRAHGVILGACMGSVPICLDVSKKLSEVAGMFPQASFLAPATISETELFDEVVSRFHRIESLRAVLANEVLHNEAIIKEGITTLDTLLVV